MLDNELYEYFEVTENLYTLRNAIRDNDSYILDEYKDKEEVMEAIYHMEKRLRTLATQLHDAGLI